MRDLLNSGRFLSAAEAAKDMEDDVQSNVISLVSTDSGEPVPVGASRQSAEPATATHAYESAVSASAEDALLLHVRFWPDTRVWEIAECPDHLDKEEWFKLLCARVGGNYRTRAGGRGFFRLTRTELEALKVRNPN